MKFITIILSTCLIKTINSIICNSKEHCIEQINNSKVTDIEILFEVFNLTESFFQDLHPERLVSIELFNISIGNIERDTFKNCDVLEDLNVQNNNITDVQYISAPKLEDLVLSKNNIIIRENVPLFNDELSSLKQLELRWCNISKLYKKTFEHSKYVKLLNLDFNNLQELDNNPFSVLTKLIELSLKNNKLIRLPDSLFSTNKNLENVNLLNNLLTTLPSELFCNLTQIKTIDLVNNNITYFNVTVNEFINDPFTFNIHEQSITCLHDECNFSNDTKSCNKNNCRIYILNKPCNINTKLDSEVGFYAWIFFGTVIIIQIIMLLVFIIVYYKDKNKMKIK